MFSVASPTGRLAAARVKSLHVTASSKTPLERLPSSCVSPSRGDDRVDTEASTIAVEREDKLLAKLASDYRKPDGLFDLPMPE
jgi:nucleotidyltransferase/DNA polymerase involved in DNA repair